jgi:hypothetical protein
MMIHVSLNSHESKTIKTPTRTRIPEAGAKTFIPRKPASSLNLARRIPSFSLRILNARI